MFASCCQCGPDVLYINWPKEYSFHILLLTSSPRVSMVDSSTDDDDRKLPSEISRLCLSVHGVQQHSQRSKQHRPHVVGTNDSSGRDSSMMAHNSPSRLGSSQAQALVLCVQHLASFSSSSNATVLATMISSKGE